MRSSPIRPHAAFIDTSAYFALVDERERPHVTAHAISRWLAAERWRLITTNFIVAETHALLLKRLGRTIALRVLHDIDVSSMTIIRVDEADEQRAREIIAAYDDKDFSLTDALSFAVMERFELTNVFTFDSDFT